MRNIFFVFVLLTASYAEAQFKYDFYSNPDSATLYVNGEEECRTPCRYKFYWHDSVDDQMVFRIEAPGYEPWHDTLANKPMTFDRFISAKLDIAMPVHTFDSVVAPLDFEQIILKDLEENQVIGQLEKTGRRGTESIKWHGYFGKELDDFETTFYKAMKKAGYPTLYALLEEEALFKSQMRTRPQRPRFLIGAEVDDVRISMKENDKNTIRKGIEVGVKVAVDVKWQIYDKKINKVVEEYENTGIALSRNTRRSHNFSIEDAVQLSLRDFIQNSSIRELVSGSGSYDAIFAGGAEDSIASFKLQTIVLPEFEKQGSMIKRAGESCVTIVTDRGFGSGVIISDEGLVLSAYHVVDDAREIKVKFNNDLTLEADVLVFDQESDIVLLDITGSGFKSLPMGTDDDAPLGEDVLTIGTPSHLDLGQSLAKGIISGRRLKDDMVYLQIDMAVSPGNSGGPLINKDGKVVGIVQSKIVEEGVEGIGFAISIEEAMKRLGIEVTE